ncbi:hypothetical protein GGU11DRAFT_743714 [Lentinula aff. detonsa]|nr:hypothetical protein GGU11DRAFT_743714 [Lentinula aff. detonsa]
MIIPQNGPLLNDPLREAPERIRKTHKDPETIYCLTKLPIDSKLKMNYEKQTRNATRRERAIGGVEDNVSDVSSYISIPEEEYDKITKDQPSFDRVKCWLSAHTLSWLADKQKQLRTRSRDSDNTLPNLATTQPLKCFRVNDQLNEVDPTTHLFISFDQAFLDLGLHGYNVPLALFTNKNIDLLNNNSISFHRTKISHIEGKPQILDLVDVMKKMRDNRDAGTTRELELEYFEWIEATENLYNYQVSLYAEGTDATGNTLVFSKIKLTLSNSTTYGRTSNSKCARSIKTKGELDTLISSTTTIPMGHQSGLLETDLTFFTREPERGFAPTGTYSPTARRNAPPQTTYAHYAAGPIQPSNGTLPAEYPIPQMSNTVDKEPLYPILEWHNFSNTKTIRKSLNSTTTELTEIYDRIITPYNASASPSSLLDATSGPLTLSWQNT